MGVADYCSGYLTKSLSCGPETETPIPSTTRVLSSLIKQNGGGGRFVHFTGVS
jgi:hypothetical protein